MARNTLKLELSGFNELVTKLEGLTGDVKKTVTEALARAGETIGKDTAAAVQKPNLPAKGKYSQGETEKAISQKPDVIWSGVQAEIGVGFDYSKPGAGGFLITGTPRMAPDKTLKKMYTTKSYMSKVQSEMADTVQKAIKNKLGG